MDDLTQRLPHDVLADVLRRLRTTSPCSLAASCCVCKAWCAVVDAHRLLAELLPQSLTGIFVHLEGCTTAPKLLSLGVSSVNIAPFDYLDTRDHECLKITQHCNGLLLLSDKDDEEVWVLNPATHKWAHLPPPPAMCTPGLEDSDHAEEYYDDQYLVFDPVVSPHYEVFLVKSVPSDSWPYEPPQIREREWPPSTFVLLVFSSRTDRWEERPFARDGEAARTIGYLVG
ncbi:hypothetical protein VPH35_108089 [Triticum aestivum]|uniref:uncharacterized protein n=1 Tax=Triticum aestivum TaxID=4565 RepID=UPI001D02568F|nr:uncharacterized protein LOC123138665 [Triticum aestivum]